MSADAGAADADPSLASLETLDSRDVRALTEPLLAFDDLGWADGAPGLWVVYGEDGSEYRVDVEMGRCTCDDCFYRDAHCKHVRCVEFLTGAREVPGWVDESRLHGWLREQLGIGLRRRCFSSSLCVSQNLLQCIPYG